MLKRIICLTFFLTSLFISICLANENEVRMDSVKGVALLDALSDSKGEGKYAGYQKLNGYPGEDKFQIYYEDSSHDTIISFHATYEDLQGLNLDEVWDFTMPNGTPMKLTRRQVYNIFLSYGGTPVEKYISEVFPGAYDDWFMGMVFSQDAARLVGKYLEKKHGIKKVNLHRIDDVKIETNPNQNADERDLDGMG